MEEIKLGTFEVKKIEEKTTENDKGEKTVFSYTLEDIGGTTITLKSLEKHESLTLGTEVDIKFKSDQAKLEQFEEEKPEMASKKQLKFIADLREKKVDGDEEYQKFLEHAQVSSATELLRGQASVLIDSLQLLDDKPVDEQPEKKPKSKKKGAKKDK